MKSFITKIFILFFCVNSNAQKLEFFSDVDFGFLSHQQLKKFHNSLADDITFEAETSDNFNFEYGFTIGFKINSINTSFFYSNNVSGAKTSVSDFSGFFRLTNELKGSTFGAVYEKQISQFKKGMISLGARGLVTRSKLELISESRIENNQDISSLLFKFSDYGAGLVLNYRYPVFKSIVLKAYFGVDFYLGRKIKFQENKDLFLIDDAGNKVTGGWTGPNAGLGIIFPLAK